MQLRQLRLFAAMITLLAAIPVAVAQQERGDKEIALQGAVIMPLQNGGSSAEGMLVPRFGYFLSSRHFVGLENVDYFSRGHQAAGVSLLYRFYFGSKGAKFQPYTGLAPGFITNRYDTLVLREVTSQSLNSAVSQIRTSSLPSNFKDAYEANLRAAAGLAQLGCLSTNVATATACANFSISPGSRKVTYSDFMGGAELALKYYMNRRFAFEASYRLSYVRLSTPSARDVYSISNGTYTTTSQTWSFSSPVHRDGPVRGPGGFKTNATNFFLFGLSYVF